MFEISLLNTSPLLVVYIKLGQNRWPGPSSSPVLTHVFKQPIYNGVGLRSHESRTVNVLFQMVKGYYRP